MTAVDVDALDKLAAVLDDTATGLWMGQHGPGWGRVVANALLPVVDRIANQRAAEALHAAADTYDAAWPGIDPVTIDLRTRAYALAPEAHGDPS